MGLHIGQTAPDFEQDTSQGRIRFHEWCGESWVIFFSHPADFTPVCTTELGMAARLKPEFDRRRCKRIALSVDPVDSHLRWIRDIEETQSVKLDYPIVADADYSVSKLYDMFHPEANAKLTVRSVFFIDPARKIRAMITYPPATGRNFQEILRVLDGLQLTDQYSVATPVDWKDGDDVVIAPALQDPEDLKRRFPKGWKVVRPYLRITPQPNK
jgi:alkyl hydroperoxide reductase subunit AhpC